MSSAFTHFLSRLRAQGSDKADGLFLNDLVGLTPAERDEARGLLNDALRRGDTTAVNGLLLLDGAGARGALDNAIRTLPFANDVRLTAAGQLWQQTADAHYQAVMLEYLRHPSVTTRLVALGYLQNTPPIASAADEFARIVQTDPSANNRALAAELLLYSISAIPQVADSYRLYRPFMQAVESGTPDERRSALADLHSSVSSHG